MQMDQDVAQRLFCEGAIFIFVNVPRGTEFGIDMKVWNTDEKFRGIKMIPPGIHFVHYSAVSKTGEQAPRTGFFYNFRKGELVARIYDKQLEDISPTPIPPSEILTLKQNLLHLDQFLGPYPYDILDKWITLSSNLPEYLVTELSPKDQYIRSALVLVSCKDEDRPRGNNNILNTPSTSTGEADTNLISSNNKRRRRSNNRDIDDDMLPDLKPVEGTELRFTLLPEQNYPEGSTAAEITRHSLDSSYVLNFILKRHKNVTDLIGEIQFAFICFLVGHSLEAFEHWKKLIGIICSCEAAILKHRILYDLLVPMLEVQLDEIPEEFLADIVSNNNFIYIKLRDLFRTVDESSIDGRLKTKMARFRESLSEKYSWDFSNLDEVEDDEAPVVVELE